MPSSCRGACVTAHPCPKEVEPWRKSVSPRRGELEEEAEPRRSVALR
jgi:hypothetical protein